MRRKSRLEFTILALGLFAANTLEAQTDPFVGTWRLNVAKSKFEPGPALKDETRIIVTGPNGMHIAIKRVTADNRTQEFEYTTNLDGKRYPIIGDGPDGADSISANLTAVNTMRTTATKSGKMIDASTVTVSANGRSLTVTSTGTRVDGTHFKNIAVYDKE